MISVLPYYLIGVMALPQDEPDEIPGALSKPSEGPDEEDADVLPHAVDVVSLADVEFDPPDDVRFKKPPVNKNKLFFCPIRIEIENTETNSCLATTILTLT